MKTWVHNVINKPWERGARGPDSFDCYGLLYWVRNRFFGEQVPLLAEASETDLKELRRVFNSVFDGWEEIETPFEGCAVGLSKMTEPWFHHCGVWTELDDGLVVHVLGESKVVAQSVNSLKFNGWRQIKFFRYKEKPGG